MRGTVAFEARAWMVRIRQRELRTALNPATGRADDADASSRFMPGETGSAGEGDGESSGDVRRALPRLRWGRGVHAQIGLDGAWGGIEPAEAIDARRRFRRTWATRSLRARDRRGPGERLRAAPLGRSPVRESEWVSESISE